MRVEGKVSDTLNSKWSTVHTSNAYMCNKELCRIILNLRM